ncbi:hypothetical protein HDU93_009245 [Gonapodya sp. JEL0774]|nr:hypothetical protein HDU93_009245 [Gonapodya sp. JEL0774]
MAGSAVSIYDPPFANPMTLEHVRTTLRSKRVRADDPTRCRFYGKLVREGDKRDWWRRPYFEGEAKDFVWDDHIQEVELLGAMLTAFGDGVGVWGSRTRSRILYEQLHTLVSELSCKPFDLDKPLWRFYLVRGLEGGRMATIDRCHHAIADGEGMVRSLFTDQPTSAQYSLRHVAKPNPVLTFICTVYATIIGFLGYIMYALFVQTRIVKSRASLRLTGRKGERQTREFTTLDSHPRKQIYFSKDGVSLQEVKAMKDALGVSLNDVVLGVTGRAIERYLRERGALRDERMNFAIPVSSRTLSDTSLSNKLLAFNCIFPRSPMPMSAAPLPIIQYIHHVSEWMDWQKIFRPALAAQAKMLDMVLRGAWMFPASFGEASMAPSYGGISNVPGPAEPIKWGGATISKIFVSNPICHASPGSIGIAVMSYVGKMYFCIAMDETSGEELQWGDNRVYETGSARRITTLFEEEMDSLKSSIESAKKSGKAATLRGKPNRRFWSHFNTSLGESGIPIPPIWMFMVMMGVLMTLFTQVISAKMERRH